MHISVCSLSANLDHVEEFEQNTCSCPSLFVYLFMRACSLQNDELFIDTCSKPFYLDHEGKEKIEQEQRSVGSKTRV